MAVGDGVRKSTRRCCIVVREFAFRSVDMRFIFLVESRQKTFKNRIHGLFTWRSVEKEQFGEQARKLACCVLGQDNKQDAFIFIWQTDNGAKYSARRSGPI